MQWFDEINGTPQADLDVFYASLKAPQSTFDQPEMVKGCGLVEMQGGEVQGIAQNIWGAWNSSGPST